MSLMNYDSTGAPFAGKKGLSAQTTEWLELRPGRLGYSVSTSADQPHSPTRKPCPSVGECNSRAQDSGLLLTQDKPSVGKSPTST